MMSSSTHSADKRTILLVDNEAPSAQKTKKLLEKHGYSFVHVPHCEAALETVSNTAVDLILMDYDPGANGMTGSEAAKDILHCLKIPIIFFKGYTEKELVDKVKIVTGYGSVLKDFSGSVLLEAIPDMMFVLDKKGTYIDYKPDVAGLLKIPPEQFIGKTVREVLPTHVAEQIMSYVEKTFSTKQVQQFEHDMILDDLRYYFETRMAFLDENHVVSIVRDITEEQLLEYRLRENEKRYRHLFQNTLASIWEEDFGELQEEIDRLKKEGITDFKTYLDAHPEAIRELASLIKVIDVNNITLKWYGVKSKEEMRGGLERFTTYETDDILKKEIIAIAEGRTSVEGETKGRTLDGRIIDLSIRISLPAPEEELKHMIVAINDITELKRAIEHKEILMSELNHRVKNNLLMVSSFINLKEKELGEDVDLSDIQRQVGAIMMVHEDLCHSEKLGSADVRRYITRITQTVFSFTDKDFKTDFSIDIDYIPSETAVPVGLIVNEIMTNALKHGFPTGQEAVCSVKFTKNETVGQYILVLSNNGAPFPENIDLENPETLGLRLVSALVQQLDGSMELERTPHPVFTFRFPAGDE